MPEKSTISILVVDDDAFILTLVGRILEKLGYSKITTCTNGQEALNQLDPATGTPHVILVDLNMPVMDGVEFVRKLVDRYYVGSLILMSGEDPRMLQSVEKLIQAHRLSLLGRLDKPPVLETLAALLEKLAPPATSAARTRKAAYSPDEIRSAIANREFINHYQPKVVVATGEVVGVETLVRWRHPHAGMVYPDQFIGVAEDNDLIDDLTRVVLDGALAQCSAWRKSGLSLRVAVNLSMDNLHATGFADLIVSLAAGASVRPQDIILEVTESRVLQDMRSALEILTRLRLRRFGLSIDDFGTGHSSLSQLRDIPFDELKVDRGFVHGAGTNSTVRAIFEASLALARQLSMKVVAEGVEDRDDWEFLKKSRCDFAQGYFVAKPMPAEDLPRWIENWRQRARTELGVSY